MRRLPLEQTLLNGDGERRDVNAVVTEEWIGKTTPFERV